MGKLVTIEGWGVSLKKTRRDGSSHPQSGQDKEEVSSSNYVQEEVIISVLSSLL